MTRIKNTISLLELLSFRRIISMQELSEYLEVNPRTIQRMKDDLIDLGYDIETIYGPGGGYRLVGTSDLHQRDFTPQERKHILNGLNQLMDTRNFTYSNEYYEAIAKLNHHFDTESQSVHIKTVNSKSIYIENPKQYLEHVNTIKDAIKRTKRLKIEYTTNNNEYRNYTFEPYELFIVNQLWYVGGLNEKGQIRSLKLSRMHACVLLEDETFRFDEPTSKSIRVDNYGFKINPQKVKVEIKDNTYFKEFIWGENQKITPIDESKYILEVEFLNVLSAKSFILEGGHHFKVLEPENLKQWVKKEATKILENYA